jgi:putative holliday junction resolvase
VKCIAGLDFGSKRIGLATTDASGRGAYPLLTIERRSLGRDIDTIAAELKERQVTLVVVGLPLNMDGSEGPSARAARAFANRLGAAIGLPIEMYDERLTSFEAEERLRELGTSTPKRKRIADAVAAAVILEGWLGKNRCGPVDR